MTTTYAEQTEELARRLRTARLRVERLLETGALDLTHNHEEEPT